MSDYNCAELLRRLCVIERRAVAEQAA
jgi:hypothetical protein